MTSIREPKFERVWQPSLVSQNPGQKGGIEGVLRVFTSGIV